MRAGEEDLIRAELPRMPECGAIARRLLREHAGELLTGQTLDDAQLVATELANNAFRHGQGTIEFTVQMRDEHIRIELIDEGLGAVPQIGPSGSLEGGRGLLIVERVSVRWGSYPNTTHVWAELSTR
jgi:anti-sigma regulatory factor (Ser/Thr protein kinase)